MSTGSEPNELDREVDASMRMFEKAQVGPAASLTPIKPSRILVVLDGSSQDENTLASANFLREQFNTETLVLDARDGKAEQDEDLAVTLATQVSGGRPIQRQDGDAYDVILAALKDHAVDLLLTPCPFGRSFENVGIDSAGTVMDVLLSRCPIPMIVMRRDDQQLCDCVQQIEMVVGSECEVESKAAAWSFGLASTSAKINLNLVLEKEHFENIRSIIEAIQPEAQIDTEQFSAALTKTHHALHGAMAKTAAALGMSYELHPIAGEVAPPNSLDATKKLLMVLPLEVDDRFGQGFVQDRIRRSPHPILIVSGHVPETN
ncbi:universal stress protein [Rhodopirellula sp.]|nr:universal stress protein [Rhodopirellula sp.]